MSALPSAHTGADFSDGFPGIAEMGQWLREGRCSSVDLVKASLARIEALDGELHAFVAVYAEEALLAAEAADRQIAAGIHLGPLQGIPVAIKDNVDLIGRASSAGWPMLDRPATENAWIAQRLLANGAVIVGKTHMVQFALGAWGHNEQMGAPRNPWGRDVHRAPGGSSSGSAVAVAAGMVPLSIGTDTGGSVRMPASFCGITGLKPTVGKLSTQGVVPLSTTLDSVGLFTQTAADASLAYAALSGEPEKPAASLAGQRIGFLGRADLQGVQPEVLAAYDAALEVFRQAGAHLQPITLTGSFDGFADIAASIMLPEGAAFWGEQAANPALAMDGAVRPRLLAGAAIPAVQYVKALQKRDALKREIAEVLSRFDAFVTPATPHTATALADIDHGKPPVKYTRVVNLLDLCGVSLPLGLDGQQLPIGLQIAAAEGADALLMQIARAFQAATRWHETRWKA
ncbi:amidase [Xylophilus rhododendri]|uniref:Amidase n=1 Tax=Xylophilus rhododendri TaxID=2697032 RepID=A0A857JA52_9BURK|nr:amidase [Xylophilus rhododendri]QHI99862.1 amidase [Xylophilus rhododendri]